MINLLNANFYRLKKNYSFWILLTLMAFMGSFMYINNSGLHPETCVNCNNQFGEVFFNFLSLNWLFIPIFIGTFIGEEYSDGTIKNKIIIGCKRKNIYLSNLITNIIVIFLYTLIYIVTLLITSLILKFDLTIPTYKFIQLLIASILLNIVYVSLFTLISMEISNKTLSIIISFSIVICMMLMIPNIYLKSLTASGTNKLLCKIILNITPYGQAYQIMNLTDNYTYFSFISVILILIINIYAIIMINKKQFN